MLVQESEPQHSLLGDGPKRKRREKKSFFRRLAEKKGSPKIDWETIVCLVKPVDPGEEECLTQIP
jgi:hypothetical protein